MENLLSDLSFDEWVRYVFDHPVDHTLPEWYWQEDRDYWDSTSEPHVTVDYLTSLFTNPVSTLAAYNDAQINQGLWYVVSNACSNHMFALKDKHVPRQARLDCLDAMYSLSAELFLTRCSANLGYLDEQSQGAPNPLDMVCYMWWDLIPLHGPSAGDTADTILEVLSEILSLNSDACRESALHGLGHWHLYAPKKVEQTIDKFLKNARNIRPELVTYAQFARKGGVQ